LINGLLPWIISNNTQNVTLKGLHQWQKQGMHFQTTKKNTKNAEIDECWDLDVLYSPKVSKMSIFDSICERESKDLLHSIFSRQFKLNQN
jgi:hypothetical protein